METSDNTPAFGSIAPAGGELGAGDAEGMLGRIEESGSVPGSGAGPDASRPTGAPSGGPALWGMGLLMGAAAMYLFDAENGERRRAGVARRVDQYRDEIERTIERERARVRFQLRRTARETLRRVRESLVPDAAILREIHARMEEVLPFEEAAQIHIAVQRGQVTLEGAIAEDRLNRLLGRVATAPGVRGLDNRLTVRASTTR